MTTKELENQLLDRDIALYNAGITIPDLTVDKIQKMGKRIIEHREVIQTLRDDIKQQLTNKGE